MTVYFEAKRNKWCFERRFNGKPKRSRFNSEVEAREAEKLWKEGEASGTASGNALGDPTEARWPVELVPLAEAAGPRLWKPERLPQVLHSIHRVSTALKASGHSADVRRITYNTLDDAVASLKGIKAHRRQRPPSNSTIKLYLSAVHKLLTWAEKKEITGSTPKFPWPELEGALIRRDITYEEERKAYAYFLSRNRPDIAEFVECLINTGMRRGELLGLDPEDIRGAWAILTETKTDNPRGVPLTARAQAILSARLPWHGKLTEDQVRYHWDMMRSAIGLEEDPRFTLHSCRHACATRLLNAGVGVEVVQKFLGHERINTTMIYAKLHNQTLQNVAASFSFSERPAVVTTANDALKTVEDDTQAEAFRKALAS